MKTEQIFYQNGKWSAKASLGAADAVFVFTHGRCSADFSWREGLREMYQNAAIIGCSSSGAILEDSILDEAAVATAIKFEKSRIATAFEDNVNPENSFEIGQKLANSLMGDDIKHIILFSEGLNVNGSRLAEGFNSVCSKANIHVSGGLAGDGERFEKTFVITDFEPTQNRVVAMAIYGDAIVKTGCFAGWDEFGTQRVVTKSKGNVVYEIDGEKALDLYIKYLGDEAANLPTSGLKFPLSIKKNENDPYIIRTLLSVDKVERSISFAGDVPQGYICKLMKSNLDKLIEHAGFAAKEASVKEAENGACIAVSCVGRRIALGGLIEEELEILKDVLGERVTLCGFYSYGEIAPIEGLVNCFLHNQTMTVTAIYES